MLYVRRIAIVIAMLFVTSLIYAMPAAAQATRTWVSGVGDDVNPCSRTAPCKTFAGAISKTAAGGEINCLDPGGWGAVTITKSITIDCKQFPGGILNSATNGIIVNAAATDNIILRGLEIYGAGTGLNGVRFLAGGTLTIEDSVIRTDQAASPNGNGIQFSPSGASRLTVSNVKITANGNGSNGGGILIQPTGTGSATVVLNNVVVTQAGGIGAGVKVDTTGNTGAGVTVAISNSSISGGQAGLGVLTPAGAATGSVSINNSMIVGSTAGIVANGSGATIRVSGVMIVGNGTGVLTAGGGTIKSYGDNLLDGNGSPGTFTPPNLTKN